MPEDDMDNPSRANPVVLDRAVELMRAEVPVRAEWRESLMREVLAEPQPTRFAAESVAGTNARSPRMLRTFTVRPLAAIAACLLAMSAGVAGTLLYTQQVDAVQSTPLAQSGNNRDVPVIATSAANNASAGQKMIRFALVAPGATNVSIVGDFNGWNARATPLKIAADGSTWLVEMPLSTGRHVYAFVVDGDLVADPSAPRVVDHDFGSQNSVVLVGAL